MKEGVLINQVINVLLHLDVYLNDIVQQYGAWVYAILFITVFCETGLVVAPFLPGESLLITSGALAGSGILNIYVLMPLFFAASVLGDLTNLLIGRYLGRWMLSKPRRYLKPEHVKKAEDFYARYGGRAIVMARFLPVVRTLAPFVAGVARMNMLRFMLFNVIAAFLWVTVFLGAGYFFGSIPWVKENLGFVLVGIVIGVAVLPTGIGLIVRKVRSRRPSRDHPSKSIGARRSSTGARAATASTDQTVARAETVSADRTGAETERPETNDRSAGRPATEPSERDSRARSSPEEQGTE